jgi:hypothetical protein
MKRTIPDRHARPDEVFTRDLLVRSTSRLLGWRQGPGHFGQMLLHSCWGVSSTLDRGYHGQTVAYSYWLLDGVLALTRRSADPRWGLLVHDMVANLLHLQLPRGGFYHASSEFEPTYTCEESCPIHQGLPVLALLEYLRWPGADPVRKSQAEAAVEKWWAWMERYWWMRGNAWKAPLDLPGFCGVTNQDLVIVAVLALDAKLRGNRERFERFGRPVLDAYLSPAYYHREIGLFERGDRANFAERSTYYEVIIPMLELIHEATGDVRIPGVIANVCTHLFDALHTGTDGLTHIARGALTDLDDKSRIVGWEHHPYGMTAYPMLLRILRNHVRRHPDPKQELQCDQLEHTLAAYVYADGTIPTALGGDPMFAIVGHTCHLWTFLLDRLPDADVSMDVVESPCVHRTCAESTWRENGEIWAIERGGARVYAGLKRNPHGIVAGPGGILCGGDLDDLARVEVEEVVIPLASHQDRRGASA